MVVDWALTALFAVLALPCVLRLVRLDYARLGPGIRHGDLAELLLVVAMVAMLSPAGGPIPAAGWQAVLALTAGWFATAWWRGARECAHHALSAAAMCYMVTAMPHADLDHGPWLTMATMGSRLALPVVAVAAAGYFVVDAVWSGTLALRGPVVARPRWPGARRAAVAGPVLRGPSVVAGPPAITGSGQTSRALCRVAMGAGMSYLLLASAL